MVLDITGSYPPITQSNVDEQYWGFFQSLPKEYRAFLTSSNGGFVPASRYTFLAGVPVQLDAVFHPSHDDCPIEFFGLPTTQEEGDWPQDLLQASIAHAAEEFLPRDMIAIALCATSSLVCISLRPEEFGHIYYWDAQYPWRKWFFEERIKALDKMYPNADEILQYEHHPERQELIDEYNYATVVHLAPSFTEWLESCDDQREIEASSII